MKGILLAGGTGSRLWPVTRSVSKQLLPVYDKPLVYYPLSTLAGLGVRDVLVITRPVDAEAFRSLLADGSQWGMQISYASQKTPGGIAQSFIIGADFIAGERVALVLGDNIFHGPGMDIELVESTTKWGATIFAYKVANPRDYGVVEMDAEGRAVSVEEKPLEPKSELAIPGLYFYDEKVADIARRIVPSARGELEITEINHVYLKEGSLGVVRLPVGTAWLDSGTFQSLHDAGSYVRVIEERQGTKVGCIEEVVWRNGWISDNEMVTLAQTTMASGYGSYLMSLLGGPRGPRKSG